MKNFMNPCRPDCKGRQPYCHSVCLSYREYSKVLEAQRKMRVRQADICDFVSGNVARTQRGSNCRRRKK